jgi:hypothetical protein
VLGYARIRIFFGWPQSSNSLDILSSPWKDDFLMSSIKVLKRKNMVNGLVINEEKLPEYKCEACIQAKITRQAFQRSRTRRQSTPGNTP